MCLLTIPMSCSRGSAGPCTRPYTRHKEALHTEQFITLKCRSPEAHQEIHTDVATRNQPFSNFKSDASPASSDWPNKPVELTTASLSNGTGRPGKLSHLLFPPFATSVPEQKCCKSLREHSQSISVQIQPE